MCRDSEYIVADTNRNAYWSDVPSSSSLKQSISEQVLVNYMEYLIGSRIYRQCIGIPMGTDCAPLVANLFPFYYEYKYMKNLIKTNYMLAKRFSNTMRYIVSSNLLPFIVAKRHMCLQTLLWP